MATTRQLYWRTQDNNAVYVDSFIGDDNNPDGLKGANSRNRPYRTLRKAFKGSDSYEFSTNKNINAFTIICRGYFSEPMGDGIGATMTIKGDYPGAAVFDGKGIYDLSLFSIINMVVVNTPSSAQDRAALNKQGTSYGDALISQVGKTMGQLAGLGNYNWAANPGDNRSSLSGFGNGYIGGDHNIVNKVKLYYGAICCASDSQKVVFSNILHNSDVKINYFTIYTHDQCCTVYNEPLTSESELLKNRYQKSFGNSNGKFALWLFGRAGIILNNNGTIEYNNCIFTNDCTFIILSGNDSTATPTTIYSPTDVDNENGGNAVIDDTVSANGKTFKTFYDDDTNYPTIISKLNAFCANMGYTAVFNSCVYADCGAEEIMNDPENMDYTLRPKVTINGEEVDNPAIFDNGTYAGAFGPALRIPIYGANDNKTVFHSDGHAECWDDRTATGCVVSTYSADGGKIELNENSNSSNGSIHSKIITINPLKVQINSIYAMHTPLMGGGKFACMNEDTLIQTTGNTYGYNVAIPIGWYVTSGTVKFDKAVNNTSLGTINANTEIATGTLVYVNNESTKININNSSSVTEKIIYSPASSSAFPSGSGDFLPVGYFLVKDNDILLSSSQSKVSKDSVVYISTANNTRYCKFPTSADDTPPSLVLVTEPNANDVVYVRCRTSIYATVDAGGIGCGSFTGVCYLNNGSKNLWYHGHLVVPGESFYGNTTNIIQLANDAGTGVAVSGVDTNYAEHYDVAVIFDDRTDAEITNDGVARYVPTADNWVPAQLFGAYFVSKISSGTIDVDSINGQPYGSGNYRTYAANRSTSNTSIIDRVFVQFKFVCKKY